MLKARIGGFAMWISSEVVAPSRGLLTSPAQDYTSNPTGSRLDLAKPKIKTSHGSSDWSWHGSRIIQWSRLVWISRLIIVYKYPDFWKSWVRLFPHLELFVLFFFCKLSTFGFVLRCILVVICLRQSIQALFESYYSHLSLYTWVLSRLRCFEARWTRSY